MQKKKENQHLVAFFWFKIGLPSRNGVISKVYY